MTYSGAVVGNIGNVRYKLRNINLMGLYLLHDTRFNTDIISD